jgi:hypothetical protein
VSETLEKTERTERAADSATGPGEVGDAEDASPSWGWTRTHRIGLTVLLGVLLVALSVQAWRRRVPINHLPTATTGPGLIDPNTADDEALRRLPHVGPALAQRIIAFRTAYAAEHPGEKAFETADDLRLVTGIGPKLLDGMRAFISLPSADVNDVPDASQPADMPQGDATQPAPDPVPAGPGN